MSLSVKQVGVPRVLSHHLQFAQLSRHQRAAQENRFTTSEITSHHQETHGHIAQQFGDLMKRFQTSLFNATSGLQAYAKQTLQNIAGTNAARTAGAH